jgi:N-acetylmuramoyl-L-alanine amidase
MQPGIKYRWLFRVNHVDPRQLRLGCHQIARFTLFFSLVVSLISSRILFAQSTTGPAKKIPASDLFEEAVQLRTALESKPQRLRTRAEYNKVIVKYRSIYYHFSASSKADDALLAVAELYQLMGMDFKDPGSFVQAIKAYAFLEKEYPSSPHRPDALFTAAEIYLNDLRDPQTAQQVFRNLLDRYPYSTKARNARARLDDLREQSRQANRTAWPARSLTGNSLTKTPPRNSQVVTVVDSKSHSSKAATPSIEAVNKSMKGEQPLVKETLVLAKADAASELLLKDAVIKTAKIENSTPALNRQKHTKANMTAHVAVPKSDGTRSLIRTLGLKVGRIVIDPGHGGHDTGTIGPSGLQEKDLVLDISLKLKKLIEDRLGSDVTLTRSDDTFIPLEERTAIANQNQADLFLSIHANYSRNQRVNGVETFFLDFAISADAEEIAARENASAQKTIFELQDLVQQITLKEKVDESREFANTVQKSMTAHLQKARKGTKDRGVKQAPFIVLIGANMPSILSEVSFMSNPFDEKLLKSSKYRQRLAEALCRGIEAYAEALGGIKTARNIP